jgi:hypothetical protein
MRPRADHGGKAKHGAGRSARYLGIQLQARRLNEQLSQQPYSSAFSEYVCECGLKTCVQPISLTAAEFAEIRKRENCFAVVPGHASWTHEILVDDHGRYQIVQKRDSAPQLVRPTDMDTPLEL